MEDFLSIIVMLVSGYLIRFALIYSGQLWAKSFAQTVSFFLLPIITFIITKTIYGNIALSLGMIGALSIVRFRHPVKSALELIVYFDLITIGIAASVNLKYSTGLATLTILILIFLKIFNQYKIKNKKNSFYNISFNEGVDLHQLEVVAKSKILILEENKSVKSIIYDSEGNEYFYRLAFQDLDSLNDLKKKIELLDSIKKIDVSYL
jgi:hypothetical protein